MKLKTIKTNNANYLHYCRIYFLFKRRDIIMDYSLITNESLDYCVYVHVNKINGELYIGITNDLKSRWRNNGAAYKGCSHF